MSRAEKYLNLLVALAGIFGCIGTYIALPQIQALLNPIILGASSTATPVSPTVAASSTSVPNAAMTPEQFISFYFKTLNEGKFSEAYSMTSASFQDEQSLRGGVENYKGYWGRTYPTKPLPVEVTQTRLEVQNREANGFIELNHLNYDAGNMLHRYYVTLVWNESTQSWLLNSSCETPYEQGCPKM